MKIWDKGFSIDKKIEVFTIGNDRLLDVHLAEFDLEASKAHACMLHTIGILNYKEQQAILNVLDALLEEVKLDNFSIDSDVEDVHSQIEKILIQRLGDTGKKIHTARSRNDQVLTAIVLFSKRKIQSLAALIETLFEELIQQAKRYESVLLPGYTHTQVAMPSSFGLWFGAYAEMLAFDMELLAGAFQAIDHNPLGTAAGYGSSFPIDRKMTTQSLGFKDMMYVSALPQMLRGKLEWSVLTAMSSVALTLNKLTSDVCLFNSQNFNFIILPKEFTTGSSIMPHKKNPDVFELIRAKTNTLLAKPNELTLILSNLMSGYHRDFQQTKETYIAAWISMLEIVDILSYAIPHIQINPSIIDDKKYDMMFSLENVAALVAAGVPFRDAYMQVAKSVEQDTFVPNKKVRHSHEGSINKLCLDAVKQKFNRSLEKLK